MEIELEERCPRCGLEISNDTHVYCLKCGAPLHPDGIKVECCNRVIVDPWVKEFRYVPFCPHCGKRTGQVPPAQKEAAFEARQAQWRQEEEQRKRAINPPLLSGVKVRIRPEGTRLIDDLVEELNHYDSYPVVIAGSIDQVKVLSDAFKGHAKRLTISEGQLVLDVPSREKASVIDDKFQHRQPVFVMAGILPSLQLRYANRFFMAVETVSDNLLKTLGRLGSYGINQSKGAVVFEYQTEGLQERLARYREEEATISNENGGDENG